MNGLHTTGRILYAIPLGVFALLHFFNAGSMAGMVPAGFPGSGAFWVVLSGIVLAAACISLLTNMYVKYVAGALAVLLLIFILTIHLPSVLGGGSMGNLLKDLALMGAALTYAAHHGSSQQRPAPADTSQNPQ